MVFSRGHLKPQYQLPYVNKIKINQVQHNVSFETNKITKVSCPLEPKATTNSKVTQSKLSNSISTLKI